MKRGAMAVVVLLAAQLAAASVMDMCSSVGDTHVNAFPGLSHQYFDVMGEKEWIMAEGPTTPQGPKLRVQAIQKPWQQCGTVNKAITVLKHVAFQCGDFNMLMDSNWPVHNCVNYPNLGFSKDAVYNPALYIRGTNAATKRSYTGADYIKDADFAPGKTVTFTDGTGDVDNPNQGKLIVSHSACHNKDCTGSNHEHKLMLQLHCGETIFKVHVVNGGWGASYVNTYLEVPKDDDRSAIRVGDAEHRNMEGGYCGGWTTANNLFNTLNERNRNCRGNKYDSAYCHEMFTTTPKNSLFASWQHWSDGKFNADYKEEDAAAVARSMIPFNQVQWDQHKEKCIEYAQKAFPTVGYTTEPSNGKEALIEVLVDECTEDCYFGLAWSSATFDSELCEGVGFRVEQERKDIFCASSKLKAEGDKTNPRELLAPVLKSAKSPKDVDSLIALTSAVSTLADEVVSSADNIEYWKSDACMLKIQKSEDLDVTNCDGWVFKNSQSAEDAAVFKRSKSHLLSSRVSFTEKKATIDVDQTFISPVLFLGAPSLQDPQPAVARASFARLEDKSQFGVFAREPKCQAFAHGTETAGYVVMDTTHNYSGLRVFSAEIKSGDWQTLTWEDMGAAPLVFATIQSSKNGACPECVTQPEGVAGYVSVRIRSVTATSCEVRLDTDTDSISANAELESEVVAFIVTKQTEGELGDITFKTGVIQSATSSANTNGDRPVTVQSFSVTGFENPPVVLTSVQTADDNLPVNTRMLEFAEASKTYKFVLDRDTCDAAEGKARSHGAETVAWIAFEKL